MDINIKNMVCDRCISSVEHLLTRSNISYEKVLLGIAILKEPLTDLAESSLSKSLRNLGFELLEDKDSQDVEKIKNAITILVHRREESLKKYTVSAFIETQVGKDYKALSTLFSAKEGKTIEQYVIAQKVERIKELISYKELSISEIADKLHYSSVAHLSNQFKKYTGITPSQYRNVGTRNALDHL
ncbi:MAG: AraC family transcriptional regulator [Arcticibacterium sp.]|jgi:AraC family transcriptional regulator